MAALAAPSAAAPPAASAAAPPGRLRGLAADIWLLGCCLLPHCGGGAAGSADGAGSGAYGGGGAAAGPWQASEAVAYPKYPGRQVFVLDGFWDFAFLGDVSRDAAAAVRDEELCQRTRVPDAFDAREWLCAAERLGEPNCAGESERHCGRCCDVARFPRGDESCWRGGHTFERCCAPAAMGRRGVAAYRTFVPRDVSLLHFRACSMHCTVYADRQAVKEHVGGYSPFWAQLDTPGHRTKAEFELLVIVDNRFMPEWPVHQPYFDWYQAGGLLRSVEAHVLRAPGLFAEQLHVLPVLPTGTVELRFLVGGFCAGRSLRAIVSFDGAPPRQPRPLACGVGEEAWLEAVPAPRLWSPESPALHTVTLSLWDDGFGAEVDRVVVRFGLRYFRAAGNQLLLNGRDLVLRGVNRHESHPLGGIFFSEEEMLQDISLLKELGANFVRGSHYSQDQRWLDICDAHGILVWEESMGWQPRVEHLTDRLFLYQQLCALEEQINASMNHPSVVMWGFLNEGASDHQEARLAYQVLSEFARSRDPSRMVSWASKMKTQDVTLDMADVLSFNDYPGWYDTRVQEIPGVWRSYAEWVQTNHPGKPLIIGETGASGLVGFRRPGELPMWSEDLQAEILRASIVAAEAAHYMGIVIWQFTDSRVDRAYFFEDNPQQPTEELQTTLLEASVNAAREQAQAIREQTQGRVDMTREYEESARAAMALNASGTDWVEEVAVSFGATGSPMGRHLPLRPRGLNNKGLVSIDRRHKKLSFAVVASGFRGACADEQLQADAAAAAAPPPVSPRATSGWSGHFGLVVSGGVESGAVACKGCYLSVNTWNDMDSVEGTPGVRAHGHLQDGRAAHWALEQGGLLRLAGHADGRQMSLGELLAVGGPRDAHSAHVAVRLGAASLWSLEPFGDRGEVLIRVSFGPACGAYLSVQRTMLSDERDESSLFASVDARREAASVWGVLPL